MHRRRVVITGAVGYIAQRMLPDLQARWDVVPIDVAARTRTGVEVPGIVIADLARPDRNEYRRTRSSIARMSAARGSTPRRGRTTATRNFGPST
jgi:nucleoside-diphosphate-sugar epimerase